MLAAVDDADGAIAGFTEVELSGWTPAHSEQADTAALAAHRGHGLWLKAAMLRRPGRSHANPVRSYSSGGEGSQPVFDSYVRLYADLSAAPAGRPPGPPTGMDSWPRRSMKPL